MGKSRMLNQRETGIVWPPGALALRVTSASGLLSTASTSVIRALRVMTEHLSLRGSELKSSTNIKFPQKSFIPVYRLLLLNINSSKGIFLASLNCWTVFSVGELMQHNYSY